jgi:hypothetical protein
MSFNFYPFFNSSENKKASPKAIKDLEWLIGFIEGDGS